MASAPFTDNFDGYSNGDLNGQGSWSGNAVYQVQDSVYQAGSKAISFSDNSSSDLDIEKSGSAVGDGGFSVYVRTNNDSTAYNGLTVTGFESTTVHDTYFSMAAVDLDGSVKGWIWFNGNTSEREEISADTWYEVDVEWRSSDSYWRGRVNGGSWHGWFAPGNAFSTGVDKIRLRYNSSNTGQTQYLDEFSGNVTSASISPSISPSLSPSISPSISPSASLSPSASPSQSPSSSLSPSPSPSYSPSFSPSASPSYSPSISASISPSPSPSVGYFEPRTEGPSNFTERTEPTFSPTPRTEPTVTWTERTELPT